MTDKYYEETVAKLENTPAGIRLLELVRSRLEECGWSEQVRSACMKLHDEDRFHTFDELSAVIVPTARAMMPDSVKQKLVNDIEKIMMNINKQSTKKSA